MHAHNICAHRCYLGEATYKHQEEGQVLQKQVGTITKQQNQIDALTAGLQKGSAQIELSKPHRKRLRIINKRSRADKELGSHR